MNLPPLTNRHDLPTRTQRGGYLTLSCVTAALGVCACSTPSAHHGAMPQEGNPAMVKSATSSQYIADPFEPVNRGVWAVNRGLLVGVLQPSGRVYRGIVPQPARQSVKNFTKNITYPGRLVNNLLQGRWSGAGDESLRFLTNTTAGVGGLFDVASQWKLPKSEANFGQTFSRWGWQPNTFIMLPLLGPSDDSHALGAVGDHFLDPLSYSHLSLSLVTRSNGLSEQVEERARFVRTEADSYSAAKYAWSYLAKEQQPDWSVKAARHPATLQTLGVAMVRCQDPKFAEQGRELSVYLPATGRSMMFNVWMQPAVAPLVYVTPGLGSHRLALRTIAVAELLYRNGYSVVTTTNSYHPEFMERASTSPLPGYPAADCRDLLAELTAIDHLLEKKYKGRSSGRAMVGFSMGGYEALYLAANEKNAAAHSLKFDRYVAIDMPVDLPRANVTLDRYYDAPLAWSSDQRQSRINNTLHKAARVMTMPASPNTVPPFDGVESQYLVGLSFRMTLLDTIYSSQRRHNMGILQSPISHWHREACYREIMDVTFAEYVETYAYPYYRSQGISQSDFLRTLTLRSYANQLRTHKDVRVIINRNDFLLNAGDIRWLESTIGSSRLTIFSSGGHLGNLGSPPVQQAIVESLRGLR